LAGIDELHTNLLHIRQAEELRAIDEKRGGEGVELDDRDDLRGSR
jgi:hypothetical protein